MDVLIRKLERSELLLPERSCLICGRAGRVCASGRIHPAEELQQKMWNILTVSLLNRTAQDVAALAVRSLLYEVSTTPNPGLVDRNNNGSHTDMNFYTFLNSSASLYPYFEDCFRTGEATSTSPPELTFEKLRLPGKIAKRRMLYSTHGVNTHKGAIFDVVS